MKWKRRSTARKVRCTPEELKLRAQQRRAARRLLSDYVHKCVVEGARMNEVYK